MRFMTKVADLMILNLLFILTSLPVITVGASWTALYYVTMKMVRDEETGITRAYFSAFRRNFRQATLLWLMILAAAGLIALDMYILAGMESPAAAALNTAMLVLGALLLMLLQYLFPVLAKFENSVFANLKNAALIGLSQLPKTLLMSAAAVGSVYITLYSEKILAFALPVWLMLGFALMAFGNSALLVNIFDRFIPGSGENNED